MVEILSNPVKFWLGGDLVKSSEILAQLCGELPDLTVLVQNPSNQAKKLDWKLDYLPGFDSLRAGRVSWGLKEETHN